MTTTQLKFLRHNIRWSNQKGFSHPRVAIFFHFCIKSAIVIHKRNPTTTFTTCTSWVPIQAYSMVNYKFATWLTAYFNVGSLKWLFQCLWSTRYFVKTHLYRFSFPFFVLSLSQTNKVHDGWRLLPLTRYIVILGRLRLLDLRAVWKTPPSTKRKNRADN